MRVNMPPLRRKLRNFQVLPDQLSVFNELIKILKTAYEDEMYVKVHDDIKFELWTTQEYRTNSFRPRRMNGVFFAGVSINKASVSFYFHPLYLNPDMQHQLPLLLKTLWKQNSVFHITQISSELKEEISQLLELGYAFYEEKGLVRKRRRIPESNRGSASVSVAESRGYQWQIDSVGENKV